MAVGLEEQEEDEVMKKQVPEVADAPSLSSKEQTLLLELLKKCDKSDAG